jgi:hypothetical protein
MAVIELITSEIWKPIARDPNYDASTFGQIRSWYRRGGRGRRETSPTILTPKPMFNGYPHVAIRVGDRQIPYPFHKLILETFVGRCPPGMECRHFPDPSKLNNRLDNISWGTRLANNHDMDVHGTRALGEKAPWSKLTEDNVRAIRKRKVAGESATSLAIEFNVHVQAIWAIHYRRNWAHLPD